MANAVRLTPDALRQVRSGHPWVFDKSIRSGPTDASAGELAVVFDDKRKFAAIGLWDPESPIRVRILHVGKPQEIDAHWLTEKMAASVERRPELVASKATNGWRAVHGENDGLPGLVVDRYDNTAVIKLDSSAWVPWLPAIQEAVDAVLAPETVVLRCSRSVSGVVDGTVLKGAVPDGGVLFFENGLVFSADVITGNKTGHFLDQRDNRELVRAASADRAVLDVFCSNGGFSVYAASGGADSVTSVDISRDALAACGRHMTANAPSVPHQTLAGDAFDVLAELKAQGDRFDVVVVDPPSFASKAADVKGALRAYSRLTARSLAVLQPGGLLVQASCSSRVSADAFFETVHTSAVSASRPLQEVRRTEHPVDHPIGFPQGAYLKALFATG